MPDATSHLFCFGLGYSASALALAKRAEGWRVSGTRRIGEPGDELAAAGIEVVSFDDEHPLDDALHRLGPVTHLLSSIPPGTDGDPVIALHFFDLAHLERLNWVGYLSTTGVYGDRGGGWVDETAEPAPTQDRGRRRLEAENRWLDLWHAFGLRVHIFRLAGIYGPGRNPLAQARDGSAKRIVKLGQLFSRIHRDDLVAVLAASMGRPEAGAVYNVCDDRPAPPDEVVAFACALLGIAPPPATPFEEAELSDMARSFYAENRRVRNDRIKHDLGVSLAYPDYETGLRALAAAGEGQT